MAGKKQLGQILLEAGVIDEFQLKSALGYQKQWGGQLGKVLVENRFITEETLVDAVHSQTGIPVVNIQKSTIPDYLKKMVPEDLATKFCLVPVKIEGESGTPSEALIVAMAEPTNLTALDEIRFRTGKKVKALLATESSIDRSIRRNYKGEQVDDDPVAIGQAPEDIQFAGPEFAAEDMQVVQGTLEADEQNESPDSEPEIDDPFAQLESLARGPDPVQSVDDPQPVTAQPAASQSPPAPEPVVQPVSPQLPVPQPVTEPPPVPDAIIVTQPEAAAEPDPVPIEAIADAMDVDIDLGSGFEQDSQASEADEEELPEVEILEELPMAEASEVQSVDVEKPAAASEPEKVATPSPTPIEPKPAAQQPASPETASEPVPDEQGGEAFGLSGDLLGSTKSDSDSLLESDASAKQAASGPLIQMPDESDGVGSDVSAGDKPSTSTARKSAMEALLSRVGVGVADKQESVKSTAGSAVKPAAEKKAKPAEPNAVKQVDEAKPAEPNVVKQVDEAKHKSELLAAGLGDEVLNLLERLESAQTDEDLPQVMNSSHMIAAIVRLLLKKEVFSETEFLEELKGR
jgi:type II secretion system (T2SS) protein E